MAYDRSRTRRSGQAAGRIRLVKVPQCRACFTHPDAEPATPPALFRKLLAHRRTHRIRTARNPSRSSRTATVFQVVVGVDQDRLSRNKLSSPAACRAVNYRCHDRGMVAGQPRASLQFDGPGCFARMRQNAVRT